MACRLLNVVLVDGGVAASVADSSLEPRCESAWTADDSFDRLLNDDSALQSFQVCSVTISIIIIKIYNYYYLRHREEMIPSFKKKLKLKAGIDKLRHIVYVVD